MAGEGFNNEKYSPDCEKTRLWKISRWLKRIVFFGKISPEDGSRIF